ncbi:MAG TPA: TlpA disulfide reductase family protein [Gemmatimonadaceae bacterium]|jgi:peroxiredoxin
MTVRQQWGLVGGILAVIAVALFGATHLFGEGAVVAGAKAPDFHAVTLDSTARTVSLDQYRGQVVLLNIWATYCVPCRVEMPSIEDLQQKMAGRGLHIVAVSIDVPGKAQAIRDFVKHYGLTFQVLHDPDGTIAETYQTTGVPETFVIGRDGVIRKKIIGATLWNTEATRALVSQLLSEPAR